MNFILMGNEDLTERIFIACIWTMLEVGWSKTFLGAVIGASYKAQRDTIEDLQLFVMERFGINETHITTHSTNL